MELAEKRELTILFCDLIGSTVLAERLDPYDFLEMMQDYHQKVTQEINKQYGYVAQYLGDGVLAYFGYPTHFSNAAFRAVKAGLSILKMVDSYSSQFGNKHQSDLLVRIGIHQGIVVFADIGVGDQKEILALGGAPNIANRIQHLATANSVWVSQSIFKETHDKFNYVQHGEVELKGFSEKFTVYEAIQEL